jgi:hypothetical protein
MTPRGRDSGEVEREPQADYVGRRYFRQRDRAVRAVAHNFVDGGIFVLCTSLEWKPSFGTRRQGATSECLLFNPADRMVGDTARASSSGRLQRSRRGGL